MSESEIEGSLVPMTKHQARLMLEAAYLLMDMQQHDTAKEVLMGAASLMPKSEVPQLALGTLELVQKNFDKALKAYRSAQRLNPRSGLPRAHCGEALLFMGKPQEAMKELNAALDIEPEGDGARFAKALIDARDTGWDPAAPPVEK